MQADANIFDFSATIYKFITSNLKRPALARDVFQYIRTGVSEFRGVEE
jgi:hypothetical protein